MGRLIFLNKIGNNENNYIVGSNIGAQSRFVKSALKKRASNNSSGFCCGRIEKIVIFFTIKDIDLSSLSSSAKNSLKNKIKIEYANILNIDPNKINIELIQGSLIIGISINLIQDKLNNIINNPSINNSVKNSIKANLVENLGIGSHVISSIQERNVFNILPEIHNIKIKNILYSTRVLNEFNGRDRKDTFIDYYGGGENNDNNPLSSNIIKSITIFQGDTINFTIQENNNEGDATPYKLIIKDTTDNKIHEIINYTGSDSVRERTLRFTPISRGKYPFFSKNFVHGDDDNPINEIFIFNIYINVI